MDLRTNKITGIVLKIFKEPIGGKIKILVKAQIIIPNLFVKFKFENIPGLINLILNADGKRIQFIYDLIHSDI